MGAAGFWDNQEKAQELVSEMRQLQLVVKPLTELISGSEDLEVLLEFIEEEGSEESIPELSSTADRLESSLDQLELQAMMSAPEDGSAAYLSIQAGEGGTDSSDWAEMLLRMYLRWCERRGFSVELLDRSDAEEAGIRSATIRIEGDYAYGYLKGETGNHRLIRISPFDSAGRRHTSFAAVDVSPDMGEIAEIEINWDQDVREDTYRASGAGGQHINKTDSAIRLTHLETNGMAIISQTALPHQGKQAIQSTMWSA